MPDDDEYTLDEIKTALRRKLNDMGPDERETALRELERNPNLSDVVNEYRYPTPGAWTEEAFKPAAPVKVGGYVTRAGVTRPTEVEYGPTPEPPRKRVTWAPPSTPPVGTIPGVYWPGGMPKPPLGTEPYWRLPTAEETIKAGGRAGIEAAKTVGRTFQGKKPFGLIEIGKPEETPPPEGLPGVVGRMVPSFLGFGEPLTLEELRQQSPWMQAAMATGMGAPLESLFLAAQQAPAALRAATTRLKQRGRAVVATGERGVVGPFGKEGLPEVPASWEELLAIRDKTRKMISRLRSQQYSQPAEIETLERQLSQVFRNETRRLIREGKVVPPEELAKYPDLAAKVKPPPKVEIPLMITKQMEADLRGKGFTQAQIDSMAPQQAWEHLAAAKGKPDEVLDYMINFYNEKGGKAIRHPTEPGFIYVDDSLLSEAAAKDKLRNFMEIEGEKLEQRVKAEAALAKGKPPVTEIPKIEVVSPKVRVEVPPTEPPVKLPTEGPPPPPVVSKVKPPPGEVPPTPVVTPEGKLWLPEPPRTGAYMESARKEVAGSFRKKIGVFDIVEQAHQQVLKARDLGENAINYVGSYLRQAGNMTKEFGLDAQGIATKVGNPEGRSLAINDILSNYTHYTLTPAQTEIAKRHGFVYREALKLAKSYGVDISELGGPDEYWQYIARRVKGKLNPATGQFEMPPSVTGGFRMGAKISAQKERVFEEMAQGVDLGLLYEHPDQVMVQHLKGIYRLIGNKQAEDTVKGLTRAITAEAPVVFGERALAQPALRSRAAAVDLANAIDKIFTPEQEIKALRVLADISGALVGQKAALDVSAPFIQGLPVLGHDLKMALKGQPTAIWAKAYARMWRAVWNPKTIDTFRAANHDLYKRAQEAGVITGQSEFVSGIPLTGRMLGKVPVAGKTLKWAYQQTWGRAGQAYSDFLEVSRIKMFEQMEGAWERSGGNVYDLGAVVNRMSGATSAAARGVGTTRRLVERIAAFAPNYIRASLLLIKDMAGRRATAKEVQSTLATLLGVGFAVYYAEEKVRGREPKIKPWPKRLGGDGAEAFTTEIGGHRVGLGSWMYGMIKTLAEIGAIAVDDPSALVVFNDQHPLMRFAKSKQGEGLSLTRELATGKNFWGEDFETPQDYLLRVVEAITPISGQSLVEKGSGLPKTRAEIATPLLLEPLGLRVFPSNISKFNQLAERQGIAKGREWSELEPWEKAKISMSPEGRVLIKALNQKETVKRWQIRWNAYDMQVKRDVELKAGKIKGSAWKDAYYQGQSELAARLNQFDEDFKRMRYNPETPEDKALSGYYDTMDKAKSETGVFDGDKWEGLRRDYMRTLSPELQKYVEDNIGIYDTLQASIFRGLRKRLQPYWDIEDQIWAVFGDKAQEMKDRARLIDILATTDEASAKAALTPAITEALKVITEEKKEWKEANPGLADMLRKYYSY